MERPFVEEEVKKVIWSIEDDKALGPDGFTMAFYKVCWEVVMKDVMETMGDFHKNALLDKGNNATYISLIPKKKGAYQIKDFQPISLVGNMYIIISKLLACKLKEVVKDIISPTQCAFLGGKQSIDGVLIVNECIYAMLKRGNSGVLCKLDLEKAYDHVNWDFLDYMLRRLRFGCIWCEWMKKCYGIVFFSLLNGSLVEYFHDSRGLKQGIPCLCFCL